MAPPHPLQTLAGLRTLRAEILALAAEHGMINIRVFGSVARGDSHADSDIDLLVNYDATRLGLGPLLAFRDAATELLNGIPVDAVTPELLRPDVLANALDEAVPI